MKFTLLVFTCLLFLCALTYSQNKVFTETDAQITVSAGESFDIKLSSNKTTGYSWTVEYMDMNPDGVVTGTGTDYEEPQTGRLGASGYEIWHFTAMKPGFVNLVFKYVRPWETNENPAKVMTFPVNVQ